MDFPDFLNETFRRMATQGRQGRGAGGGCAYRDPRGGHCAIGFWLEDDRVFKSYMNTAGVGSIMDYLPTWMQKFGELELRELQFVHDNPDHWTSPDALWRAMEAFANGKHVPLDQSIKPMIWANWKGEPPGRLPEIKTFNPTKLKPGMQVTYDAAKDTYTYSQYVPPLKGASSPFMAFDFAT